MANGVRHGGGHAGTHGATPLEGRPPGLHVEVVNADRDLRRGRASGRPTSPGGGGLGLHLVERLASRWGVRDEPRTAVWFELDCGTGGLL